MASKLYIIPISILLTLIFFASGVQGSCSPSDIDISQKPSGFGAGNVPKYTVGIINESPDTSLYDVHVDCRSFASTTLINPSVFRRLTPGDCLVKDGQPMEPFEIIVFDYTNLLP